MRQIAPMARPSKGPRLYLYSRPGRSAVWLIRDGKRSFSTGCTGDQKAQAQIALAHYLGEGRATKRKTKVRLKERGTIYLITVEAEDRPIKIGFTEHLRKRFNHLQVGLPFAVKLEAAIDADRQVEIHLHRILDRHRIRGEWFRRTPDVERLVDCVRRNALDEFLSEQIHPSSQNAFAAAR